MTVNQTIILDVDEVLTPTIDKVILRYNREFDTQVTRNELIQYRLDHNECMSSEALKYFAEDGFFRDLAPYPDTVKLIPLLVKKGFDIVFLTAIVREGYIDRHDWLKEHFPTVSEKNYLFGSRKDMVEGDWMLDDNLEFIFSSRCKRVVCMNKPWNVAEHHPQAANLLRVSSFTQFYHMVMASMGNPNIHC